MGPASTNRRQHRIALSVLEACVLYTSARVVDIRIRRDRRSTHYRQRDRHRCDQIEPRQQVSAYVLSGITRYMKKSKDMSVDRIDEDFNVNDEPEPEQKSTRND